MFKRFKKTIEKTIDEKIHKTPASVKALDFLIISIIFLIFLLCPLFFTNLVAQGLGFEKMLLFYFLVLLGVVSWVTKAIIQGELKLKRTPLDWPIIITLVVFTISTILSLNHKDSLISAYGNSAKSLVAVLAFALFYYLVVNNINIKRIKLLFWSLICSTSLIIIYSFLQLIKIFILPIDFTKTINFNPVGSFSSLSMFIIISLPLLTIIAAQINKIHQGLKNKFILFIVRFLLIIVIIAALVILTMLKGFTFWPAAIVGLVIVLMFLLSKIVEIGRASLAIPLIVFISLIILLVLGNFNFFNLELPAEVSLSRSASWDIAKASLTKDPFFGSGPSTFYYSFTKYKDVNFNNSPLWNVRFDNASGFLFELASNVGSLGLITVVIVILIALSICFITLIKTKEKEVQSILLALFASFITALIFATLFSVNNTFILYAVLVTGLTISAAIVIYPEKFTSMELSLRTSAKYALALSAIFLGVSAGVVILFTLGIKMYLADYYAKQSLLVTVLDDKIARLEKAITLAPYQDVYYINVANHYINLANQQASQQGDFQNSLALAIERGKKAVDISPNKASANEALALIYENSSFYAKGSLEWAENFYNKVIELDPNNPTPYVRLALINMARARQETDQEEKKYFIGEAIKKYEQATQLKPDLSSAYYGKAIAYENLAQINEAIEQLKRAVITNRNNIDYRFELGRLYFNRGVANANLAQTASQEITLEENDDEELSVEPQPRQTTGIIEVNDDLILAEQLFLSIIRDVPNHANAYYSLAVLYQKLGRQDNVKTMVNALMNILTDEQIKQSVRQQFGL